jgi:hypothetical protein
MAWGARPLISTPSNGESRLQKDRTHPIGKLGNNYLFDKKKGKLFFTGLFSTREKNQWKKVFSFYRTCSFVL